MPGGSCTSTLTVPASSRSFGTRTSRRVKPPAGAVPAGSSRGRAAVAGAISASAANAAGMRCRMGSFT